jgi:hypothetical protein
VTLFSLSANTDWKLQFSVKDLIEMVLTVDFKVHNGDCGALVY